MSGTNSICNLTRLQGCTVIGFAGTDAKVAYLKELGFDEAINYKKITNLDETIQKVAPKGVDVYFDNVSIVNLLVYFINFISFQPMSCTLRIP